MGSHWKVLRDDNALQELDCFLGINKLSTNSKKMPGTVFKRTEHSEQLDDPPPYWELDVLLLAEQLDVLLLAEQLDEPPFAEHLDDFLFAEQLDDPQ